MKLVGLLLLALALVPMEAAASEPTSATVRSITQYERGRIAYWEGYVPIYDDNPVFDITIQVGPRDFVVRYESLTGYYPSAWKIGNTIQVRQHRGRFVLYNGEEEIPARIVTKGDCTASPGREGWRGNGSRLPCP